MPSSVLDLYHMEETIQQLQQKIDIQTQKIDELYVSVEKVRKYFVTSMWVGVALFVLPLIGILFATPSFLSSYTDAAANY